MSDVTPDFTLEAIRERIREKLSALYGAEQAPALFQRLMEIIGPASPSALPGPPTLPLTEQDVVLICYGDNVRRAGQPPLVTLHEVLKQTLYPSINTVHLLPFYPYSSDDGFSVIDYEAVNPELGTWEDIRALHHDFRLMFDAVFNHISAKSAWFQAFLRGEAPYTDYFVTVDPGVDLSMVVRPRTLPLLTAFETPGGTRHVWTTFSADQIDLNAQNPEVLLELVRILLFYVSQGADLIRLDAIAFLWKIPGTSSIHLPQTHTVIQLMRDVLDIVAPQVVLITETNVPHEENISYFGDGRNEAQMVYQFSLPPLTLHTLATGDSTALSQWAATLRRMSDRTTFFNFTASHDGIGVRPATGLLRQEEIDALVRRAQDHGGFVSYRTGDDGSQSPYELNINYFDAITHPEITAREPDTAVARFMVSQAIMLTIGGVPGIYFHSLFGSRNDLAGYERTGQKRSINREKLDADRLLAELADTETIRHKVFSRYKALIEARIAEPAFHPLGAQRILDLGPAAFAIERDAPGGAGRVIALHNVRGETVQVALPAGGRDLLGGAEYAAGSLALAPYQVLWLKTGD